MNKQIKMKYKIFDYSFKQAKKIGVVIKPSITQGKKIDVFDKAGNYLTSIGDINYLDYPSYIKLFGKRYADERRKLYKIRHQRYRTKKNTRSWFADQILW